LVDRSGPAPLESIELARPGARARVRERDPSDRITGRGERADGDQHRTLRHRTLRIPRDGGEARPGALDGVHRAEDFVAAALRLAEFRLPVAAARLAAAWRCV
jgi:hypothetical protein